MQHSTNFNMNLPEGYDQFDVGHFNDNTRIIDTQLKAVKDVTDQVTNYQKKLTTTLSQGGTQVEFTDPAIGADSMIDVYASVYGVNPKTVTVSGNTCTLTFDAAEQPLTIGLVVTNWRNQ